jgi:hypothetical protein
MSTFKNLRYKSPGTPQTRGSRRAAAAAAIEESRRRLLSVANLLPSPLTVERNVIPVDVTTYPEQQEHSRASGFQHETQALAVEVLEIL